MVGSPGSSGGHGRSSAHCGGCDQACDEHESCSAGSCKCSDEYEAGSGNCVSLDDDPDNCGSCGNACDSGQVCADSACCNASMLLLGDEDSTGNAAMRTAYQTAGMTVTLIDGGTTAYAGAPAADDFQVVVASFGRYTASVSMPQEGQNAIAEAHTAGTGYIAFELANGGVAIATCAGCDYSGEYDGAAVVAREGNGGRVVHFANEGNESDLHRDPTFVTVAVNAALWAAGCK